MSKPILDIWQFFVSLLNEAGQKPVYSPPRDSRKIDPRVPPAPNHFHGRDAVAWRFGYEDFLYNRDSSQNRYADWRYDNRKKLSDVTISLRYRWYAGWLAAREDTGRTPTTPPSEL